MDNGSSALVLFYSFFWAAALGVSGRYQSFQTAAMLRAGAEARRAWSRFGVSLLLVNVFPIAWFLFLYNCVVPSRTGLWPIVAAAVGSFSVFGFHRILHAFIASDRRFKKYYTEDQVKQVRDLGHFKDPQTFASVPPLLGCADLTSPRLPEKWRPQSRRWP